MARQPRQSPAAALAHEPASSNSAAALDASAPDAEASPQIGDVLPKFVQRTPWLRWLGPLSGEKRIVLLLAAFAALVAIPWMGATGFWDPWEGHYGEVAREMITRGDYLNPWWESVWFLSKPALDLWLMVAGMLVAHTNGPERYVGIYTEWCVRFPFAFISAMGAILLFVAASRNIGRRAALFGGVALVTSPLFVFLSRQAVPDPVFVGLLTSAMACLGIVLFEHEPPAGTVPAPGQTLSQRDGWLIAFYAFVGLATLSKGMLAFAIPGAVVLVYCIVTGEWFRLKRLRLAMGTLIVLAICAPWYGHMFAFAGRDEEGKNFFERFIIHDHFQRLAVGVHTTTPGGTFIYFIEQIGFDTFPWVFAFPGAFARMGRVRVRPKTRRERMELFLFLWVIIAFAVFAFSATKFHHYCFPVLPPLLVFCGIWLDDLLNEGLRPHVGELLAGAVFYGLIAHDLSAPTASNAGYPGPKHLTDMFVYNYERPYPAKEVDPRPVFDILFTAAPLVVLSPWLFDRLGQLWSAVKAIFSKSARAELKSAVSARMSGAPIAHDEAPQDRKVMVAGVFALAISLAIFLGWFHWRELSVHWTQRDLFWTYYQQSQPDEPIAAYQMNWRGENFYSRNTITQIGRSNDPMIPLGDYVNGPGRRKWFLVEQSRLNALRQAIGNAARLRVVESRNIKFALVVAEPSQMGAPQMAPQPQMPGPYAPGRPQEQSGGAPAMAPQPAPQGNVGSPP